MIYDLPKGQGKIAQEVIRRGLQKECADFMSQIKEFVNTPDTGERTPHDLYLELFRKVDAFDGHIAKRYNGLGGSRYIFTVINQYIDGVLTDDDLRLFNDEAYQNIRKILQKREE